MATNNEQINRSLRYAKILHVFFLVTILSYIRTLMRLESLGLHPVFQRDDPILTYVSAVLAILAAGAFAFGIYLPRWMFKHSRKRPSLLTIHLIRIGLFGSAAIYGLGLGMLGAMWLVILPFFLVATVALLCSFPTKGRWKRMLE